MLVLINSCYVFTSLNLCSISVKETTVDPTLKFPLDVLFRSDGLHVQSAYAKTHKFTPTSRLYHIPNWVVPLRYVKHS